MAFRGAYSFSARTVIKAVQNLGPIFAALLIIQGYASAQDVDQSTPTPCVDQLPPGWLSRPITSPAAEDRQAIMDLISSYNWALDNKDPTAFGDLFTENVVYEVCKAGGNEQVFETDNRDDVLVYVQQLMNFLISNALRTRHYVSNTIIDASEGKTVRGKSTMLVLLHSAVSEEPEFDYSATLKAEFEKGEDNLWRFSRFTLITDVTVSASGNVRAR